MELQIITKVRNLIFLYNQRVVLTLRKIIYNYFINILKAFIFHPIVRKTGFHDTRLVAKIYEKVFSIYRGKTEIIEYFGCTFKVPQNDITIAPALVNGTYELNELLIMRELIEDSKVIFDIGANIGIFSIIASKKIPKSKIVAFEPEENNLKLFKSNIELNNCGNINIEPMLVGDKCVDKVKLYLAEGCGTHSIIAESSEFIELEQVTVDSYVQNKNIVPDFIKIDVEGAESQIFIGMAETIKHKPTIMFEFASKYFKRSLYAKEVLETLEKIYGGFYIIDSPSLNELKKVPLNKLLESWYCNVLLMKD